MTDGDGDWVEGAIHHPGALRSLAEEEGGIGDDGKIKRDWLEAKSHEEGTTGRRARLALELKGFKK